MSLSKIILSKIILNDWWIWIVGVGEEGELKKHIKLAYFKLLL